MSGEQPR